MSTALPRSRARRRGSHRAPGAQALQRPDAPTRRRRPTTTAFFLLPQESQPAEGSIDWPLQGQQTTTLIGQSRTADDSIDQVATASRRQYGLTIAGPTSALLASTEPSGTLAREQLVQARRRLPTVFVFVGTVLLCPPTPTAHGPRCALDDVPCVTTAWPRGLRAQFSPHRGTLSGPMKSEARRMELMTSLHGVSLQSPSSWYLA